MPFMGDQFDETRFIEALTQHQPALEAFCYANLANRSDAQEVHQATSVKLWQKAADWDPNTPFLPWAFTVARFTILSHFRDKKRDRLVFDEDVLEAMSTETEQAACQFDERRDLLANCMAKLKREQVSLLHSHYTANQSLKDIATSTGKSLSAVKMALMRLRQQLSVCVDRQLKAGI